MKVRDQKQDHSWWSLRRNLLCSLLRRWNQLMAETVLMTSNWSKIWKVKVHNSIQTTLHPTDSCWCQTVFPMSDLIMRAENDKIVIQMSHLYLSINCSFFFLIGWCQSLDMQGKNLTRLHSIRIECYNSNHVKYINLRALCQTLEKKDSYKMLHYNTRQPAKN